MDAQTLLRANHTAIAVFTKGPKFHLNPDGSGSTGDWVIDPKLDVDKVIVYQRKEDTNEVYVADYDGLSPAGERRHKIHFLNARLVDSTDKPWTEFAGPGQNPIRYIHGEE